jgi:nucleolar protein TMA23
MNSHAILTSQGWRGEGNSLHPTDNSIGLSKPLLIGRKADKTGVGKVLHYTSDQWWLNAFDQKLKGLDTSKTGAITQTIKEGKLDAIAVGSGKYAGLYADFVSGGTLGGTLTPDDEELAVQLKHEDDDQARTKRKEEKKARKAARRLRKAEKAEKASKAPVTESAAEAPVAAVGSAARKAEASTICKDEEQKRRTRKEKRRRRKEEKT